MRGKVVNMLAVTAERPSRQRANMFQKLSHKHKCMLTFYFNRTTHTNFQNYIPVDNMFFLHTDIRSTSILRTIKVHVESNFPFGPPMEVFNHFNAISDTKMQIF